MTAGVGAPGEPGHGGDGPRAAGRHDGAGPQPGSSPAPRVITYDPVAGPVDAEAAERGELVPVPGLAQQQDAAAYLMAQAEDSGDYHDGAARWRQWQAQRERERAERERERAETERERAARERAARENALDTARAIRSYIGRYLYIPPGAREACTGVLALWAVHTHAYRAAGVTPRLAVIAAGKGAGKTTALEILSTLAASPSPIVVAPTAPVVRLMAAQDLTIFLDEIDTLTRGAAGGEIAAVLNSGYKAGGAVPRAARGGGLDFTSTFAPVAFAGIADDEGRLPLPDTTMDRAITIRLDRPAGTARPPRFRAELMRDDPQVTRMRDWARNWAEASSAALSNSSPELPPLSSPRAEQIWEPLLAIADLLGGEFAAQAPAWAAQTDRQAAAQTDRQAAAPPARPARAGGPRRAGGLREKVLAYLQDRPGREFTPHKIGKALGHSSGAVSSALTALARDGQAEEAAGRPRRFKAGPAAGPEAGT